MKRSKRIRGSAEKRKKECRILTNWIEEFGTVNEAIEKDIARLRTTGTYLQANDLRDDNLKRIFVDFKRQFGSIRNGMGSFRKDLKLLGYQYNVSRRMFRKKTDHRRVSFFAFETILLGLRNSSESLLFFDVSTFMFEINPHRAWQSKESPAYFYSSTNYRRFHLLLAVGISGVFAYQVILGGMKKEATAEFLYECWKEMQRKQPGAQLKVVLDNATLHKTELMKKLCVETGMSFIFTAPHSPFMNSIELCFRFLKSSYKNCHTIDELIN